MSFVRSLTAGTLERRLPALLRSRLASFLRLVVHEPPRWLKIVVLASIVASIGYHELRSSAIQSRLLSRYAASLSYTIEPGPSPHIAFPRGGPFDEQRGYSRLAEFQRRLGVAGYHVVEQARQSSRTTRLVRWGITPPYREPAVAGLVVRDAHGPTLYDARGGSETFSTFEEVPPLIVSTLLFMENRELARPTDSRSNPAVDWRRFVRAGALYAASELGLPARVEGGSTLAVQLEKYRHSAHGRTASPLDKLRQITAASLKAYRDGPDTRATRHQVIVDYLNTMPLAAAPGYGEVYGLGNGLRVWFGTDLTQIRRALTASGPSVGKARAYKHVLALLYAVRAPTRYLLESSPLLEQKVTAYADLLLASRVIDRDLQRMLRSVPLDLGKRAPGPRAALVERRATDVIREDLRHLLELRSLYEVDRLHLEVESTVDGKLQAAATRLFRQLETREVVEARGLRAERMLASGDPGRVVYSLLLFERTPEANLLRVQADNLGRPFDINTGMKLELGSTAKLRTVVRYLEVVAALHGELAGLDGETLGRHAREARDPITRWAAETLRQKLEPDLAAFLGRALDRTYSASPDEVFFTGGGVHTFHNFDPRDDTRVLSVREALVRSTNLVFIRLMRDLVRFHEARLPYDAQAILTQPAHPERQRILQGMADEESRHRLARAYAKYHGREPVAIVKRLLGENATSLHPLAIVFFAWHPGADAAALYHWLATQVEFTSADDATSLERAYDNPRLTLADYGYLLGRHPLEIWCAGELSRNPRLSWDELLARSSEARRVSSAWLFQPRHRHAQDLRLRTWIEQDAFARMTPHWRRLGFPFERLVSSYATAIGSSADRPAALAELMGIIVNDGVRRPVHAVRRLRFAPDTPYHTVFEPSPTREERVLPAPVARALRGVLAEVVESGTARRVSGAFVQSDGTPVVVGGKTGSGDNRFETFARGGRVVSSRAVSRTGAFVFYIGDRYFGVVTASVSGTAADDYRFTSALPLAVLKLLASEINARLTQAPARRSSCARC